MIQVDQQTFIDTCKNAKSMHEASCILGIHFNTFKRYAIKFGCYDKNQGRKGFERTWGTHNKIPLNEILEGLHPSYQTFKLKKRLLSEEIFDNKCSKCGTSEWNGEVLNCELDHIDGNRTNHKLENLRMLCPNCHSQTPTFTSKNRKK